MSLFVPCGGLYEHPHISNLVNMLKSVFCVSLAIGEKLLSYRWDGESITSFSEFDSQDGVESLAFVTLTNYIWNFDLFQSVDFNF